MVTATYRRLIGFLALCLAVVALAAPTAAADDWWASTQPASGTALRPDDRPGPRGPGTAVDSRPIVVVDRPNGFDWVDAGVGAAAALGLVLLASGVSLVARRHRKASVPAL